LRIPRYRQVYDTMRRAMSSGELPPGARLPSTRALAAKLRVSRNTVITAYEMLAAEDLIRTVKGSGTRVRGAVAYPQLPDPRLILRDAQYPAKALHFSDREDNHIYLHR
jgi:GntR family transcriptional regulator/MocR family aminotransferase